MHTVLYEGECVSPIMPTLLVFIDSLSIAWFLLQVKGEPARGAGEAGTAAAGVTVEESLFEQDEDLDDLDDDET